LLAFGWLHTVLHWRESKAIRLIIRVRLNHDVNTYFIRLEFGSIIADNLSVTLGAVALTVHIICDPVLTPRAVLTTFIVGLMVVLTTASLLTFVLELYAV
jgi:hypothetical protein